MLTPDFFNRPTLTVARDLLGKYLVRKYKGVVTAHLITEVEAYDGFADKASHASRGQTPHNTPMFGKPGTIYVYFTYGMHWMLNIVCGDKGYPAAILIRGAGEIVGPARLTKALAIDKTLTNKALGKKNGLWVEDRGDRVPKRSIKRTPRIGVDYAGVWAKKPWRFVIKQSDIL